MPPGILQGHHDVQRHQYDANIAEPGAIKRGPAGHDAGVPRRRSGDDGVDARRGAGDLPVLRHVQLPECNGWCSYGKQHARLLLNLNYLELNNTRNVTLPYDAIQFISFLLVHRKFAFAWIAKGGVEKLLRINTRSSASVAVAKSLLYLSRSSDVMEAVCGLSESTLDDIVDYALDLLEHSYETGRSAIAGFFHCALLYRPVLKRFDEKDGPRKLLNYFPR
ncbi:hypothetical protein L596_017036 [Steinernema carpocapsae]|uniref:Uncharacterized protein n=1 Tax=Steinernema carpocapsae TaxID=34508 RepID=A0A4U5N0R7_STECR|nr:hypothetical protein L596_017036 [Steinernema carpocapsae]